MYGLEFRICLGFRVRLWTLGLRGVGFRFEGSQRADTGLLHLGSVIKTL